MIPEPNHHMLGARMRPAKELRPHPANKSIYGDEPVDQDLVESIRKFGVKEAIVITSDGVILSGHRRVKALLEIDPEAEVWCEVHPTLEDDLDEREALIEYNRHRHKTFSQVMNEANLLWRIEGERAKKRKGVKQPEPDIRANLPTGTEETGRARDIVAEKVGMKPRTYAKAKKVVEAAEAGDAKAQEAVKAIDAGEMSIDRAHREVVVAKAPAKEAGVAVDHRIQVFFPSPTEGEPERARHFDGEMPAVGEHALQWIRLRRSCGEPIDRILYNHTIVTVQTLEHMVETACKREGRLPEKEPPAPAVEEVAQAAGPKPAPVQSPVVIPPEILAIGPDEQVNIGVWYQREGMEKPDYTHSRQPLADGVIGMTRWMQYAEVDPGYTYPKIKIGQHEVSREVLEALRPWGRMPEEKEHTISVYYTVAGVPYVMWFDGVPNEAAQKAVAWLDGADVEVEVRRMHFSDKHGADCDIRREGLEGLAAPATWKPTKKTPLPPAGCCPERRIGTDGKCTGCGTVILPELQARCLHLVRDEVEAMLQFDRLPYETVAIVEVTGGFAIMVTPAKEIPEWLADRLNEEDGE